MARTWSVTSKACAPAPLALLVDGAPTSSGRVCQVTDDAVQAEPSRYAASVRPDAPPSCQSRSSADTTAQWPAGGRSKARSALAFAPALDRTVSVVGWAAVGAA